MHDASNRLSWRLPGWLAPSLLVVSAALVLLVMAGCPADALPPLEDNPTVAPTQAEPPSPRPTLTWLPGSRVGAQGVHGPARVNWNPVTFQGEPPVAYDIEIRWPYSNRTESRSVGPNETSAIFDIGVETKGVSQVGNVFVRARWDTAESEASAAEVADNPGTWQITDYSAISRPDHNNLEYGMVRVRWGEARNADGEPADRYELVETAWGSQASGTFAPGRGVRATIDGAGRSGDYLVRDYGEGGGFHLRAVWLSSGPGGGAEIREWPLPGQTSFPSSSEHGTWENYRVPQPTYQVTQSRLQATLETPDCTFVRWHLVGFAPAGFAKNQPYPDQFLDPVVTDITGPENQATSATCSTTHELDYDGPLAPGTYYRLHAAVSTTFGGSVDRMVSHQGHSISRALRTNPVRWESSDESPWVRVSGWAVDTDQPKDHSVTIHVFRNGRRVGGTSASKPYADAVSASYVRPPSSEQYGSNHGYSLDLPRPPKGNHHYCLYAFEAESGDGQGKWHRLDCHNVFRVDGAVGAFDALHRLGNGDVVAVGSAEEYSRRSGTDDHQAKVVFYVDGVRVKRAPTRPVKATFHSGLYFPGGWSDNWRQPQQQRFHVVIPTSPGARSVCAIAQSAGRNQHLGCRLIP